MVALKIVTVLGLLETLTDTESLTLCSHRSARRLGLRRWHEGTCFYVRMVCSLAFRDVSRFREQVMSTFNLSNKRLIYMLWFKVMKCFLLAKSTLQQRRLIQFRILTRNTLIWTLFYAFDISSCHVWLSLNLLCFGLLCTFCLDMWYIETVFLYVSSTGSVVWAITMIRFYRVLILHSPRAGMVFGHSISYSCSCICNHGKRVRYVSLLRPS